MNTTLNGLKEYLFDQLNRITDDSLDSTQLFDEIERSKAIVAISKTIIETGNLMLDAQRLRMQEGSYVNMGLLEGEDA